MYFCTRENRSPQVPKRFAEKIDKQPVAHSFDIRLNPCDTYYKLISNC